MVGDTVYLDYAAATPVDPAVLTAMQPYFSEIFYNPSASYAAARQAKQALEAARGQVAHWLGSRPSEVVFTAGGTEANNLAINGIMRRFPDVNVVISSIEHESIRRPAQSYDCREVAVQADGRVALDDLEAKIDDQTVLVSIMYANNEIGTVQPIRDIAQRIAKIRAQRGDKGLPLLLHTDACQAGNYLDLHVARLGVDLLTLNGGKLYGPKQSGALYVKAGLELEPQILGGGQEYNLRSGTENVSAAVGLGVALDVAQQQRHDETQRLQQLQTNFTAAIMKQVPSASLNGSQKYRLPNNVHLTIPGKDNERLLIELDERGILAASGSACNASNDEPSHVLAACGLDEHAIRSSLRFSLGRQTTAADLDRVVDALATLVV